jgi:NADH-ubiquinone oxidoreductase chain 6
MRKISINNMYTLFLLNETFTNGYIIEILDFISIVSIFCGIFVIISKNPIVSVLYLIGLFLSISCYLILLGINFIGLSYLLVYVGAVSILFLFILMLINIRISELLNNTRNSIPLGIMVIIALNISIYQILPNNILLDNISRYVDPNNLNYLFYNNLLYYFIIVISNLKGNKENNNIYNVSNIIWDGNLSEISDIASIGNIIYTSYSIWLIITSIILLLAMVGAIIITIKQKK